MAISKTGYRTGSLLAIAGACVLAACSGFIRGPSRKASENPADIPVAQVFQRVESEKNDYLLMPHDLLAISVYQEEDLTREVLVGQGGTISLPMIGEVKVAGLTIVGAQSEITRLLRNYLVDPYVSIQVKKYHSSRIFVLGEVTNSGTYDLPNDHALTALEAIALAGGFTKLAAQARTRVLRKIQGVIHTYPVLIPEIISGEKSKDIQLQQGDVVYVPQRVF